MSKVLTFRLSMAKLTQVDRRAAELGRDRSGYVRALIDHDLSRPPARRHKFASEDLIGAYNTGLGSATNATIRRRARERLVRAREKNR